MHVRTACRLIGFIFACALALPAFSQENSCALIEQRRGSQPLIMVEFLEAAGCLGGGSDKDPVAVSVKDTIAKGAGNRVDDALRQVANYVDRSGRERAAPSRPLLVALLAEIESVRVKIAQQAPLEEVDVRGWEWDRERFRGLPKLDLSTLNIRCDNAEEAKCVEARAAGKVVLRAAALVHQALVLRQKDTYEAALNASRVRDAKWTGYFDDARLQFPWELYINGLRYGREARKAGGFGEPPSDQFILLHPGVGMEYVRGAPSGSRFQPALVLELVGYNRWRWTDAGKMENAYGASLIQTYSDRAGLSSSRPGVMFHVQNKYSLALTRDNGKTGIVLSIDLAKLVTRVDDEARSRFRLGGGN